MAMTMNYCFREGIIYASLEALVPETHFVRKLDRCIDWRFIYSWVAHLYSPAGRPSIDPVILFKMLCINIVFGFNSMRRTCRECDMNVAYRWFLGIPFEEKIPDYSTWSQNYIRRYGDSDIFSQIFEYILCRIQEQGLLDLTTLFGDLKERSRIWCWMQDMLPRRSAVPFFRRDRSCMYLINVP